MVYWTWETCYHPLARYKIIFNQNIDLVIEPGKDVCITSFRGIITLSS